MEFVKLARKNISKKGRDGRGEEVKKRRRGTLSSFHLSEVICTSPEIFIRPYLLTDLLRPLIKLLSFAKFNFQIKFIINKLEFSYNTWPAMLAGRLWCKGKTHL